MDCIVNNAKTGVTVDVEGYVATALADYSTALEAATTLATALEDYPTEAELSTTLADYAKVVAAPAAANSTGVAGTIAYDASYVYVCVATDTWVRAALTTWP